MRKMNIRRQEKIRVYVVACLIPQTRFGVKNGSSIAIRLKCLGNLRSNDLLEKQTTGLHVHDFSHTDQLCSDRAGQGASEELSLTVQI